MKCISCNRVRLSDTGYRSYQAVEKRQEEAEMQGSRERKAEAYAQYVEVLSERQRSRSAPQ